MFDEKIVSTLRTDSFWDCNNGLNSIREVERYFLNREVGLNVALPKREENYEKKFVENFTSEKSNSWNLKASDGKGFGLFANTFINSGEVILRIPREKMMYVRDTNVSLNMGVSKYNEVMNELIKKWGDNRSAQLAILLLFNCSLGNSSEFYNYIQVLPRPESHSVPLYWTNADFETIKAHDPYVGSSSPMSGVTMQAIKTIRAVYILFLRLSVDISTIKKQCKFPVDLLHRLDFYFSWSYFKWAMAIVSSRQNQIPVDQTSRIALVPLWDMINHELREYGFENNMTTGFNTEINCLEFSAYRNFTIDEEITMCYGPRSNENLLLYAGFTLESNIYDNVLFPLQSFSVGETVKIRELAYNKFAKDLSLPRLATISKSNGSLLLTHVSLNFFELNNASGFVPIPVLAAAVALSVTSKAEVALLIRITNLTYDGLLSVIPKNLLDSAILLLHNNVEENINLWGASIKRLESSESLVIKFYSNVLKGNLKVLCDVQKLIVNLLQKKD